VPEFVLHARYEDLCEKMGAGQRPYMPAQSPWNGASRLIYDETVVS
jgi:hypothetical protein